MLKAAALALVSIGAIPALGWAEAALRLGAKDHGRAVTVRLGAEFTLALRQNVTTGHSWQVVSHGEPAVEQVGEGAFVADSSLHGAGGTVTFRFRAVAAGRGEIRLVYRRPWEKETKPADEFSATIVVEK